MFVPRRFADQMASLAIIRSDEWIVMIPPVQLTGPGSYCANENPSISAEERTEQKTLLPVKNAVHVLKLIEVVIGC